MVLVRTYRTVFCRPPNPNAQHLRCVAQLDVDITEVLPYLNTTLGGHQYFPSPPSLTLKLPGKLVTLHANEIAINILRDREEALAILDWLIEEINETWNRREAIEPTYGVAAKKSVLEILRTLPRDNCGRCGHSTCMVFAVRVSEGLSRVEDCPFGTQVER